MSKLRMGPPPVGGAPPRFVVKAQRVAKPPTPWTWTICEEGRLDPLRRSARLYRSAEEAWAVGRAVLERVGKPAGATAPEP